MMFRPKYCSNCGEKVERAEWRLWTSRRFCELCETEFKHIDLVPFAAVAIGLFLSIFGIAGFLRETPRSQEVAKVATSTNTAKKLQASEVLPGPSVEPANSKQPPNISHPANLQNTEQPSRKANTSEDAVYYCGALTKKGTPCTRRVKAKGYCWQHAKSGQITPTRF